jgi:hypothetical protein
MGKDSSVLLKRAHKAFYPAFVAPSVTARAAVPQRPNQFEMANHRDQFADICRTEWSNNHLVPRNAVRSRDPDLLVLVA